MIISIQKNYLKLCGKLNEKIFERFLENGVRFTTHSNTNNNLKSNY
jgi:hypothetical protein